MPKLENSRELEEALIVLSTYDEGPIVLYKYLLELQGDDDYKYHFNQTDSLSRCGNLPKNSLSCSKTGGRSGKAKHVESGSLAAGS